MLTRRRAALVIVNLTVVARVASGAGAVVGAFAIRSVIDVSTAVSGAAVLTGIGSATIRSELAVETSVSQFAVARVAVDELFTADGASSTTRAGPALVVVDTSYEESKDARGA